MKISADSRSPFYGGVLGYHMIKSVFLNGEKVNLPVEFSTEENYVDVIDTSVTSDVVTTRLSGTITYDFSEEFSKEEIEKELQSFLIATG